MDESWRMRMGMPSVPGRRSGADRNSSRSVFAADDFADVFGGPPRSVLPRQFSGCSTSFYEEIFRPELVSESEKSGRSLPEFRIPARSEGFYSDIFGSDDEFQRRSRERSRPNSKAKSKSNSSSVLSSEELSPLRPVIGDDVALSSFASKLRYSNYCWFRGYVQLFSLQLILLTIIPLLLRFNCLFLVLLGFTFAEVLGVFRENKEQWRLSVTFSCPFTKIWRQSHFQLIVFFFPKFLWNKFQFSVNCFILYEWLGFFFVPMPWNYWVGNWMRSDHCS